MRLTFCREILSWENELFTTTIVSAIQTRTTRFIQLLDPEYCLEVLGLRHFVHNCIPSAIFLWKKKCIHDVLRSCKTKMHHTTNLGCAVGQRTDSTRKTWQEPPLLMCSSEPFSSSAVKMMTPCYTGRGRKNM